MADPPSYYPQGWDSSRWQTASEEDFATLTDGQFARFHAGLRADLGDLGAEEFLGGMLRGRAEARPAPSSLATPNFLLALENLRAADGGFEEWGFVVFRTAGYGDGGWARGLKGRIEGLIDEQFASAAATAADGAAAAVAEDVRRAREKFGLMWVEEPGLEGATTGEVARRFRELSVPVGLDHSLFLCVDGSSLRSMALGRSGSDHVLAVSCTCGLEPSGDEADDERYTGSFKVAAGSLVTELFAVVGDGMLTPYEIGVGVTEDTVWTGTSRAGRRKAAVQ